MPPKKSKKSSKKSKKKKSLNAGPAKIKPESSIAALTAAHSRLTKEELLRLTPLRRDLSFDAAFARLSLCFKGLGGEHFDEIAQTLSTDWSASTAHGTNVRVYRVPASDANELTDRTLSLLDLGCVPGPFVDTPENPVMRYDIIYDFLPKAHGPIMMREPS